jgi:2-dehydro-3-deoxyphosphogluconate aldolase/(4S)-4-hydroxy-2-oxoglutarate aldolase
MAGLNSTPSRQGNDPGAFGRSAVIPVVTIDDPGRAVALARALVAGGLTAIEVTLRTPGAMECIRAIASEVADMIVGAGTILESRQMDEAIAAGARFLVSPGATDRLIDAAHASGFAWLPGAGTAAEAMRLAEAGFSHQKFFPAEPSGGVAFLKALAPVLPEIRFCPTGGVEAKNASAYLALPNVFAVGGSWVTPSAAVANGDYGLIERLARDAASLRRADERA